MKYKFISNIFYIIIYVYAYYSFFGDFILISLAEYKSTAFILFDALFLLLGLITLRSISDKIYFGLFIILTLLSQVYNQSFDTIQYLNGFREFVPVFSSPFVIKYLLSQNERKTINSFIRFLKLFLLLQIPAALLQYYRYGPGDDVGGTLGSGNSGTITILIYIATFFLFKYENINFTIKDIKKMAFIFALWIPTFINETKISFVLLPIFFLFQLKLNKSQIIKSTIVILILLPVLFYSLVTVYNTNERYNSVEFDEEYVTNYLLGDESEINYSEETDLPRFLRLSIGFKILSEETYSIYLGKGLGQFKGGTTLSKTDFALMNEIIMSGSIIYIFFILMQLGILGIVLLLLHILRYIFSNNNFQDNNTILFYFIMTVIAIFYGLSFRVAMFSIVFFYTILILKKSGKCIQTGNLYSIRIQRM